MVQHRQLNLLHDFSQLGVFDVVFCRNVLIYFDQDTKVDVLGRLARITAPHGYLVLGAAETVVGPPFPGTWTGRISALNFPASVAATAFR